MEFIVKYVHTYKECDLEERVQMESFCLWLPIEHLDQLLCTTEKSIKQPWVC